MFSKIYRYLKMLKIENGFVEGRNIFEHKDNLKFYRCKWDPEARKWRTPDNTTKLQAYFDKVNQQKNENLKDYWKEACENCGYNFAKKGTPEYDEVKEEMKRLIQIDKEEEHIYEKN